MKISRFRKINSGELGAWRVKRCVVLQTAFIEHLQFGEQIVFKLLLTISAQMQPAFPLGINFASSKETTPDPPGFCLNNSDCRRMLTPHKKHPSIR